MGLKKSFFRISPGLTDVFFRKSLLWASNAIAPSLAQSRRQEIISLDNYFSYN
jgi:hypothetical protein